MSENGSQFAWVIERGDSDASAPMYFTGVDLQGGRIDWDADHLKAVRFARQRDAEMIREDLEENPFRPKHRVCEHGWG